MSRPFIELRTLHRGSLSPDLVRHLYTRQLPGTVVVLAERPNVMLSAISKQWQSLIPKVQRELSSTLTVSRVAELNRVVSRMQHFRMTGVKPEASQQYGLYVVQPHELHELPARCHTVYVTCPVDEVYFNSLADKMPDDALLVRY